MAFISSFLERRRVRKAAEKAADEARWQAWKRRFDADCAAEAKRMKDPAYRRHRELIEVIERESRRCRHSYDDGGGYGILGD